ncbi:MAG: phosphatase PAP2 family protein [Rhodospirillaceae bacterium]
MTVLEKRLCWGVGLTGLVLVMFPAIDLGVARLFFLPGVADPTKRFLFNELPLASAVHALAIWGSALLGLGLLAGFLWCAVRLRPLLGLTSLGWLFLLAALLVGPGLTANLLFKDNWHRARPVQIEEFGGASRFTPALVMAEAKQCDHNCAFVCGDASAGFFLTAFAYVARRRRREIFWAGIGAGAVTGLVRIGQGAHFLSDVVFAGLVILAVTAALHALFWGRAATVAWWREVVLRGG